MWISISYNHDYFFSQFYFAGVLPLAARITTYEVSVSTGDVRGAGTNANVYVIMYGAEGDTGQSNEEIHHVLNIKMTIM